jgi:hypothetical protein
VRLESVSGWVWDIRFEQWELGFSYLSEFAKREGNCRVLAVYRTLDGYRLGVWVMAQRKNKNDLSLTQKVQLESIQGWAWDGMDEKWQTGYRYLLEFIGREGHCKVEQRYRTSDGYRLGGWVSVQRCRQEILTATRRELLETTPGWVWDVLVDQWETGFQYLTEFTNIEGHSRVHAKYRTSDGYHLGRWLSTQRTVKVDLLAERKARLEALPGWQW